jgi:hypothetical protein
VQQADITTKWPLDPEKETAAQAATWNGRAITKPQHHNFYRTRAKNATPVAVLATFREGAFAGFLPLASRASARAALLEGGVQ